VKSVGNSSFTAELSSVLQCLPSSKQWTVRACQGYPRLPEQIPDITGTVDALPSPLPVPIFEQSTQAVTIPEVAATADDPFSEKISMDGTQFFFDDAEGTKFIDSLGMFK
jgi:hypothetical protein